MSDTKRTRLTAMTTDANFANILTNLNKVIDLMPTSMYEEIKLVVEQTRSMATSDTEYSGNVNFLLKASHIPLREEPVELPKISAVRKALDATHYGMNEAKESILEALAVAKLSGNKAVMPKTLLHSNAPGCGKSSLAHSIGKAIGRPVVSIPLGGVTDSQKLLAGFLRSFKGSMEGKIANGILKSKTMSPVFLLDEIDKCHDTASLLSLLDGQNTEFKDDYFNFGLDVSGATFIATANNYYDIDPALRDRFETITLDGYSAEEKMTIIEKYVLPKELKNAGLTKKQFKVSHSVVEYLVRGYSMTSGVRQLEVMIRKAVRKAAVAILDGKKSYSLTLKRVEDIFGEPYGTNEVDVTPTVGGLTGLAYINDYLGTTIPFTVIKDRSHSNVKILSNAGQDMIESLSIAHAHIANSAEDYGLPEDALDKVGLTAGFTGNGSMPKSGPSGGMLFGLAIISLLRGKAIKEGIAVTGEISLNGQISAVGGIAQKTKAAALAGYMTVILPADCETTYYETTEQSVIDCLDVHFVDTLKEAVEVAFE